MSAVQLQLRGGTSAEHAAFAGASKEVTVDTTKNAVVVHSGGAAGSGVTMATEQYVIDRVTSGLLPPLYISGLICSVNGSDPTNDTDISAGSCTDSTGAVGMIVTAALTKRLDAAWAAGTGNGGLDTGSIANYDATSTTSLTIGTGSKVFTTQSGKTMPVGNKIRALSAANNANYMEGVVASYTSTTLTVTVTDVGGSGTFADWTINAEETFHVHIIRNPTDGAVDALYSTSPTAPTMPTGYTQFRAVMAVIRELAAIVPYDQYNEVVKFRTHRLAYNSTTIVTDVLLDLRGPKGVKHMPMIFADLQQNTAGSAVLLLSDGNIATAEENIARTAVASEWSIVHCNNFVTDTNGKLRFKILNGSGTILSARVFALGFNYPRGS